MASEFTVEYLKDEILDLKKRLHTTTSENHLLKVKVRKLKTELDKKDKQLESILDPSKTSCIRKIISERGATMIIHLKQRIEELEEKLKDKDNLIKKLQINLQTTKVYQPRESSLERKHLSLKNKECSHDSSNLQKLRSRSLTVTTPVPSLKTNYLKSRSDIQMEYVRLAQNLQKIKQANSAPKQRPTSNYETSKTMENKLAQTSVSVNLENKNSENGNDVEKYFERLLDEIKQIKDNVSTLSTEQENTKKILKDKNRNMEILARKVKHLQKSTFKTSPTKIQNYKLRNTESEGKNSSNSYSQDSFEDDSPNYSPKKSSTNEISKESTILSNIESVSDDDDVETGESK